MNGGDLTLIIFTNGYDPQVAARSVPCAGKVIFREERDLSEVSIDTEWMGYLFSDEVLEEKLAEALPVFFQSEYECLVCFKWMNNHQAFITPRFFRKGISFEPGSLYPTVIDSGNIKITRVLNGLILDAPNGSH